jgi:hypothetical protein
MLHMHVVCPWLTAKMVTLQVLAPFEELSAGMCRAQGPSQALVLAAAAVPQQVPSLVFCG